MKKYFLLGLILWVFQAQAQTFDFHTSDTTDQNKSYPMYYTGELKYHFGAHLPTGVSSLKELEENPFSAMEFRLGVKGYGRKKWHQFFNYPTYGLGYYQAVFHPKSNVLGNPSAVFLYFNAPFKKGKKVEFGYDLGIGISYNFIGYDPESNPDQTAIGSDANVYFAASLEARYKLSKRLEGTTGLDFTHFSNGRTRTPNKGVNLVALNTAVKYTFKPRDRRTRKRIQKDLPGQPEFIRHVLPEHKKQWEYYVFLNGGVNTSSINFEDRSTYYACGSMGLDVMRHYSRVGKYGLGLDFFYDASLVENYAEDYGGDESKVPTRKLFYSGIHIGHELMVQRFTVVTHLGFAFREIKDKGSVYARVGLRYDVSKRFWGRVALKVPNGFVADFIEWGIGYSFFKAEKN